jgi:hypothetical protein
LNGGVLGLQTLSAIAEAATSKIVFTAMLLSNSHCTMYDSEASSSLHPLPSFDDWIGQGPHAHPIPNDIFFNDDP